METKSFTFNYVAEHRREAENIRSRYMPKEENKLERLRELDRRVRDAGALLSLSIGVIGSLVFGVAMCIGLGALAGESWLMILLGVLGTLIMIPAYPIYKFMQRKVREELSPEIIRLSDEIMQLGSDAKTDVSDAKGEVM